MSLKNQAISGVKWASVAAIVASVIQLIKVAVLARFLDKADFGLMAMAIFVVGISTIFIDMGISNALIHKQEVNKYQLSTLFWANIILGIVIFLFILVCAPWIAYLYKTPELKGVIDWIGVTFLIIPLGQQFDALLRRDLKFKSLAIRDIIGSMVGLTVSVILAIKGFGVYALVYANLAGAATATTLLFVLGMLNYRPQFVFSYRSIKGKGFFSFGLFQMGEKLINYFNSNFDVMLIGGLLGMNALGLYNIAKTLTMKPYQIVNPIITKVAFPVLSKVQHETAKLKVAYLKIINILTSTNAPIYILMIILAEPLIRVAFGLNWLAAAGILQLLAIGYICSSIANPVGALQLARGRADLGFYWNLGLLCLLPATIWLGSHWGLMGVALALTVFKMIIALAPSWYFVIRPLCGAKWKEYSLSYAKPVFMAVLAGIIPWIIISFILNQASSLVQLIIGSLLMGVAYLLITVMLNKALINEVLSFMPQRIRKILLWKRLGYSG